MSFIPMVSSSPPPMDNDDGGWGDDDDFGDFATVHPVTQQNGDGFADFAAFEPSNVPQNTYQPIDDVNKKTNDLDTAAAINNFGSESEGWAEFNNHDSARDSECNEIGSDNQSRDITLQSDEPSQLSDNYDSELNSPDKELSTHGTEEKQSSFKLHTDCPSNIDIHNSTSQESFSDSGISSHDVSPAVKPDPQTPDPNAQIDLSHPSTDQVIVEEIMTSHSPSANDDTNNIVVNEETLESETLSSQTNVSQESSDARESRENDESSVPVSLQSLSIADDKTENMDNDFGEFADLDNGNDLSAFNQIPEPKSCTDTKVVHNSDCNSVNETTATDANSETTSSSINVKEAPLESQTEETISGEENSLKCENSDAVTTEEKKLTTAQHSTSVCESDPCNSSSCDNIQSQRQNIESEPDACQSNPSETDSNHIETDSNHIETDSNHIETDSNHIETDSNHIDTSEKYLQNEVASSQSNSDSPEQSNEISNGETVNEDAIIDSVQELNISCDHNIQSNQQKHDVNTTNDETHSNVSELAKQDNSVSATISEAIVESVKHDGIDMKESSLGTTEGIERSEYAVNDTEASCEVEESNEPAVADDDDDFGGFADFESRKDKAESDDESQKTTPPEPETADGEEEKDEWSSFDVPEPGSADDANAVEGEKDQQEKQNEDKAESDGESQKTTPEPQTADHEKDKDEWSSFDDPKPGSADDANAVEGEKDQGEKQNEADDDEWSAFDSGGVVAEESGEWAAFASPAKAEGAEPEAGGEWAAFGAEVAREDNDDDDWHTFADSDQTGDFKPRPSTISDDEGDDFGEFGDAADTDDAFGGFETHAQQAPAKAVSLDAVLSSCFPPKSDLNGNLDCDPTFLAKCIEIEDCVKHEIVNKATGKMRETKSYYTRILGHAISYHIKIVAYVTPWKRDFIYYLSLDVVTIERNVWNNLKDMERTLALKYQWAHSDSYQTLLRAIHVDTRNMLVGHKKPAIPIFAANIGILEPTHKGTLEPTPAPSTIKQTSILDVAVGPVPSGNTHQDIPPVDFDWKDSGLTNPLDANIAPLDLDFFMTSVSYTINTPSLAAKKEQEFLKELEPSPSKQAPPAPDPATAPLHHLIAGIGTLKPRKALSKEADDVILELPDFSFMRARVLMFPLRVDDTGGDAGGNT